MSQNVEVGRAIDSAQHFPDANFPLAPDSIWHAYAEYWRNTNLPSEQLALQQRRMVRVNTLISDFCKDYLQPHVYTAAMLGPIADSLGSLEQTSQALQALGEFDANSSDEDSLYVLGLLADKPVVQEFWQQQLGELHASDPQLLSLLESTDQQLIDSNPVWKTKAKLIRPRLMNDLLDNVNLETLLIQSAETLEYLDSDQAAPNNITLQKVHQAESILAPLGEIIGFDGLAMALQSRAYVLRSTFSDQLEPLIYARSLISERGGKNQVEQDVQSLFTTLFGEAIHEQVIEHTEPHGIVIGEGLCTPNDLRVIWRLKSVGSLARKLALGENLENPPMDIIGATIIADTNKQLAEQLGRIIERSHEDVHIKLTPTPERTDAVHVKGTKGYIDTVRKGLGFRSIDAMRRFVDVKEVPPGGHQVCKVTLTHSAPGRPELRAEIQLTTKIDRIESRLGSAAHLGYKYADRPDPIYLTGISGRKSLLNVVGLIPASIPRALEFQQFIRSNYAH